MCLHLRYIWILKCSTAFYIFYIIVSNIDFSAQTTLWPCCHFFRLFLCFCLEENSAHTTNDTGFLYFLTTWVKLSLCYRIWSIFCRLDVSSFKIALLLLHSFLKLLLALRLNFLSFTPRFYQRLRWSLELRDRTLALSSYVKKFLPFNLIIIESIWYRPLFWIIE